MRRSVVRSYLRSVEPRRSRLSGVLPSFVRSVNPAVIRDQQSEANPAYAAAIPADLPEIEFWLKVLTLDPDTYGLKE